MNKVFLVSILHTAIHIATSTGLRSDIYVFGLTWVGYRIVGVL
jgi:hypothetical protein